MIQQEYPILEFDEEKNALIRPSNHQGKFLLVKTLCR